MTYSGCGTIYSLDESGSEKVLHRFQGGSDGALPNDTALVDVNGTLYGTTTTGGSSICRSQTETGCGILLAYAVKMDPKCFEMFLGKTETRAGAHVGWAQFIADGSGCIAPHSGSLCDFYACAVSHNDGAARAADRIHNLSQWH